MYYYIRTIPVVYGQVDRIVIFDEYVYSFCLHDVVNCIHMIYIRVHVYRRNPPKHLIIQPQSVNIGYYIVQRL